VIPVVETLYALQRFTAPIQVLDQGFVRLVNVSGDDGAIVTAARVTTGKGRSEHVWGPLVPDGRADEPSWHKICQVCKVAVDCIESGFAGAGAEDSVCVEGDRRFIRFMMREKHTSPFEFAEITLHMRLPMDVWRQMVRHRTASVQEYSTRYSPAVDAMATTRHDAWRAQAKGNRQGSGGAVTTWPSGYAGRPDTGPLPPGAATPGEYLSAEEERLHEHAREVYAARLAFGVANEQARKDLPLSNYTDVYWKCDLHNLFHFLGLRLDEHAQQEIRAYAEVIRAIVATWVPLSYEAFVDYRLDAHTFSREEMAILRHVLWENRASATAEACLGGSKLSRREIATFKAAFGLKEKSC
jgi:flavin-dependent thymidylate synthase